MPIVEGYFTAHEPAALARQRARARRGMRGRGAVGLLSLYAVAACGRVSFAPISSEPGHDAATIDAQMQDTADSNMVLDPSLVAWFPLNDAAAPFRERVTQTDATCIAGACPTAVTNGVATNVTFEATSQQCLAFPDSGQLQLQSFTLFVRATQNSTANMAHLGKRVGPGFANSWGLEAGPQFEPSALAFAASSDQNNNVFAASAANTVSVGSTHNLAATYASPTMTIYIDGAVAGTANLPGPLAYAPTAMVIGCDANATFNGLYFDGTLRDVRIYNRVLSQSEIAALN